MQPTSIGVAFRKQLSDGNSGIEAAEVMLTATLPADDSHDKLYLGDLASDLLAEARAAVHFELERSPSLAVRRALEHQEPPPPRPRPPAPDPSQNPNVALENIPF